MLSTEKRSLAFPFLWQALGWLMVALVMVSSLLPHQPEPPLVTSDKTQHLLAYGILMFWFRMAFTARLLWISFLIGLGIVLELLQGLSGYRYFDYIDIVANTSGVLVGLLLGATPLNVALEWLDQWLAVWTGRRIHSQL